MTQVCSTSNFSRALQKSPLRIPGSNPLASGLEKRLLLCLHRPEQGKSLVQFFRGCMGRRVSWMFPAD